MRKYPGVFYLVFTILGIVSAEKFQIAPWVLIVGALLTFLIGYTRFARFGFKSSAGLWFGLTLLFLSGLHFALSVYFTGSDHLSHFVEQGQAAHIYGQVVDWPQPRADRIDAVVKLDSAGYRFNRQVSGKLLLRISDTTSILQRGDRLEFYATIYPISNSLDQKNNYFRYLQRRGIAGTVYLTTLLDVRIDSESEFGIIRRTDGLRQQILSSFNHNLSPTAAALASGFLIGETRNIPPEIYNWFRDSGTLHLLAVSGSNVALVLLVALWMVRPLRLTRTTRSMVLLGVIFVFSLLSYGEPSVVRASVMAALVVTARLIGRRYDLNNTIAVTALLILLFDPAQFYSIGFQLSFVTAWALIFVTPPIHKLFVRQHTKVWYRFILLPIIVSLIAQVASSPLILFYFDRIPLWGVLANLVIVPLVSIAVVAIVILLLLNLVWPLLAFAFGSMVTAFFELIAHLLRFFGEGRILTLGAEISAYFIFVIYTVFFMVVRGLNSKKMRRLVVITTLVLTNSFLIGDVIAGFEKKPDYHLLTFKIPGGTGLLVKPSAATKADLIIGNLRETDFPVDQVILDPLLKKNKIRSIDKLIVLSAEFNAFDDLFRLALRYPTETLYVHPTLEILSRDVLSAMGEKSLSDHLIPLSRSGDQSGSSGYFWHNEILELKIDTTRLLMANEILPLANSIESGKDDMADILLIGRTLPAKSIEIIDSLGNFPITTIFTQSPILERRIQGGIKTGKGPEPGRQVNLNLLSYKLLTVNLSDSR